MSQNTSPVVTKSTKIPLPLSTQKNLEKSSIHDFLKALLVIQSLVAIFVSGFKYL